jgi:hypothetical protein
MNEGVNGGYGVLMILAVLAVVLPIVGTLGFAALRLMLRDDVYFPEEG